MIERTKQEQAVVADLADAGCDNEQKELVIVPGAAHVDLYDNFDKILFDKLETLTHYGNGKRRCEHEGFTVKRQHPQKRLHLSRPLGSGKDAECRGSGNGDHPDGRRPRPGLHRLQRLCRKRTVRLWR